MKVLGIILSVIIIIIAIPLIVALFVNNSYFIKREVVINRSKDEVFNYIKMLKNQDHYSVWVMMDPNMKKTYRGTDGTPGFVYAWNGNKKAGEGEQELKSLIEGEKIDIEVRFKRPFENVAKTPFSLQALSDNSTKVIWGMEGSNKYPMNFMNLFMDNMLGKDLEKSLTNLKGILEKSN